MRRSAIRILAVFVLSLLGAPVAMHVVVHDLHHDHHDGGAQYSPNPAHGDHEHPIVSSDAPRVRTPADRFTAFVSFSTTNPVASLPGTDYERNVIAFGALRLDDDVGPQSLLSTFLI